MPIVNEATRGAYRYLLAGRDPREPRWGRIEQRAVVIGEENAGSVLALRLHAYQLTYHRRGVMDTERLGYAMGPQPWDRKTAHERAMYFMGAVQEELAKTGTR